MLGSGVLNVRRLLKQGIKVGLGTDVAGGYSTSVLDAVRQAIIASRCVSFTERDEEGNPYEALSIQVPTPPLPASVSGHSQHLTTVNMCPLPPRPCLSSLSSIPLLACCAWVVQEVFFLATQGGADVLGLGSVIGNFAKGKVMDAVVVDPKISHGPLDLFDGESLHSAFEKFLFLGDDRNIEQVRHSHRHGHDRVGNKEC